MKKSLIALAVLAASGVAMAQSSVTLYGVADLGLVKSNGISAQMSGNGTMNNGNSRLGVRGVEDLGGGLKASFNFEQGINAESGKTDANTFQRAAWLGLSGNFGSVRLGRSLTPSYYGIAAWELTGAANYSAVANQFGFVAAGSRNDSQFAYTTPNFGGFSATLGYIMKPDNVVVGGADEGNAKYDLNVIYANGPIAAALSYNKTKDFKGNASLGGSYDFGVAKIAASWQDGYKGGRGIEGQQKQSGFTIGGTVPIGAFSVTLDVARDTKAKDTDVLVEGKYALSKRTFAYAAYYKDGEKKLTTGAKNHLGLGIRHNF